MSKNDNNDEKQPNDVQEDFNIDQDIEIEMNEEFDDSSIEGKLKKLKSQLKSVKQKEQEYLLGWQKERAAFANFKTEEGKKRKDRMQMMKIDFVADLFPVLDSFDMAMGNRESWESVDANWRTGVEYIYQQFMTVLDGYGVTTIDQVDIDFDPMIHEPSETIAVDDATSDNKIIKIIQKGYRSSDTTIRPAKVNVGKYEG